MGSVSQRMFTQTPLIFMMFDFHLCPSPPHGFGQMHLGCHMLQCLNLLVLQSLWSREFLPHKWSDSLLHCTPYMYIVCFHLDNDGVLLSHPFSLLKTEVIPLLFVLVLVKQSFVDWPEHDPSCSCFISL